MSDLNVAAITGRLCADPELKHTNDGLAVCRLRVASNRKRGEREYRTFIDVKVFGKTAEAVAKYKKKGDAVSVRGTLCFEQWEDKDGAKHSKHSILADEVNFGPKARNAEEHPEAEAEPARPAARVAKGNGKDHAEEPAEEEIPF